MEDHGLCLDSGVTGSDNAEGDITGLTHLPCQYGFERATGLRENKVTLKFLKLVLKPHKMSKFCSYFYEANIYVYKVQTSSFVQEYL